MNTDALRKFIRKIDSWYYTYIGEIKIPKWRMYFPSYDYNKNLNCLTIKFYDCSSMTRHVTKKHLLDYEVNMYPKYKWLSLCGITIWFPYTWDEIKDKTCNRLEGSDIEDFIQLNKNIDKEMKAIKKEAVDLIYHADSCAKILKENGFHGKAEALEKRYLKLGKRFGLLPDVKDVKPTESKEEVKE